MVDALGQTSTELNKPVVAKVLDSPITGIAPWIVLSLLAGPGRFDLAFGISLAMSLVVLGADLVRGRSLKILACADVAFFSVLLVIGQLVSGSGRDWLGIWSSEISNIVLAVIALGSMALRVPFTIQYAREHVAREQWSSRVFWRVNYVITGAWGAAFVVAAVAGWYGDGVLHDPNDLWTGWVIQIAAILFAMKFTEWYPQVAVARALRAAGQQSDPPSIGPLLLPMTAWLVPAGIFSLSFDSGPTWFGIALIVLGVLLARAFGARSTPARSKQGASVRRQQ